MKPSHATTQTKHSRQKERHSKGSEKRVILNIEETKEQQVWASEVEGKS